MLGVNDKFLMSSPTISSDPVTPGNPAPSIQEKKSPAEVADPSDPSPIISFQAVHPCTAPA